MKKRGIMIMVWVVLAMAFSSLACVWSGTDVATMRISRLGVVRGSGDVVEEERPVTGFSEVVLAGIGDLSIEIGETESLRIQAENSLMAYIQTEVHDGTLTIRTRDNLRPKRPIRFYLTVKELDKLMLSGLGDIRASDLEASHFAVRISGVGDIDIGELDAKRLDVIISGSGDLEIGGGQIAEQAIIISGTGDYRAGDVRSDVVEITTSGVGDATLWATECLDVQTSGSGSVSYYGSPRVDFSRSGTGSLESLGDR
jgi:hypothetical protein